MKLNIGWRIVSFLALLIYAFLVITVIILLAQNLGLALIMGITLTFLVYAAWKLFTGEARSRKIALGMVIAGGTVLAIELVNFLSDQKNRRALVIVGAVTAVYLLIIAVLRKKYWEERRRKGELSGETANFKKPFLIVNPKSGDGRAIKAEIPELARQRGIEVLLTRKGVDVRTIAEEAVHAGADVLGVSGGDGSIGAVAKVALDHDLPIVVLPGGTRCHFARDLGLDPKRITDSLAGFSGVERRIDAAEINGRIFLNNASFGLYADIVDHPDYRENKLNVGREVLSEIVTGTKKPYSLRFHHGGKKFKRAVQILVGVNRYNTLKVSELGQRDKLDEGVLQINALTKLNTRIMRQLLGVLSFKETINQNESDFDQWVDSTFTVESPGKQMVVGVDGEREVYQTPVNIKVLPGALRIYVPPEGIRNRQKNPFSLPVPRQMWHSFSE